MGNSSQRLWGWSVHCYRFNQQGEKTAWGIRHRLYSHLTKPGLLSRLTGYLKMQWSISPPLTSQVQQATSPPGWRSTAVTKAGRDVDCCSHQRETSYALPKAELRRPAGRPSRGRSGGDRKDRCCQASVVAGQTAVDGDPLHDHRLSSVGEGSQQSPCVCLYRRPLGSRVIFQQGQSRHRVGTDDDWVRGVTIFDV